uniref:Putative restriction endonuclease domain-containing protein n=1 Tax=Cyanothece sp. (strain PCC 7425 / ATCC 29141) TaxID=395961 RepID=B8HPB1_CYAP4
MVAIAKTLTLEEFLELPETKPASEFINAEVMQKPMPQGKHSRLQFKLCNIIAAVTEETKIAGVFPELRCTFGGASIVPDVAIVRWDRIPREGSGQVANRFNLHPDWAIEILSPEQSHAKLLAKLLFCSEQGTELGWLIDPQEESVLIVFTEQRVQILSGNASLPILQGIPLSLTVDQVFSWLSL